MRILHVITGLKLGGAEIMLERLLSATRADASQEVISLTDRGVMAERIERLGVPTHALELRRYPSPSRFGALVRMVRRFRPDVVQTWMYHADLLGGLAAKVAGRAKIVWGIHNSDLDATQTRRATRWTVAACARLSHAIPDAILCVSRAARDFHVRARYAADKFEVIPNGFDLAAYRPDPAVRLEVRSELGAEDGAVLIGLVARVDPQKDHTTLIRAASRMAVRVPEARFVLCGEGATEGNAALAAALDEHRVRDRFLLLGRRSDMPRVMAALDIATLSSAYGEAFPLAIGEAMACGIPCVVTNVGDSAFLVGQAGRVVPPRRHEQLADALQAMVALGAEGRRALGLAGRARVEEHFSLPVIAARYAALYRRVLGSA
jgi:glycosyltransferase involved in cell wall biosynthesis